jgi:hypothetical protein
MVGAVGSENSQSFVNVLTEGASANLSQAFSLAVVNTSAREINTGQVFVNSLIVTNTPMQASQLFTMVVGQGRVDTPKVKAWTFTLDGHDFYVLRLGDKSTLVYDVLSEQWMTWYSADLGRLRFTQGINWQGSGSYSSGYGTNIVLGDDTLGVLWFFDTDQPYDEDAVTGDELFLPFTRKAIGQVPVDMRKAIPCFEVYLSGDSGYYTGNDRAITLSISDDDGKTYSNQGTITADPANYAQEFVWRSLGQIRDPGRLFLIEDNGALKRINNFDMSLGSEG